MSNYLVLARRTRPQSLAELVGQDAISNSLKGMLETKKIPHAFLFTGTRGTGKTSTARILAKSLNCEQGPTTTPCQTCRHCVQITACAHEDVFEIDAASNTGVDNIRELRESTYFYPVSARYKIFVIDEVHMLSPGAFNALLKTLEEPPQQVIFILATTELHKIPVTIRSRCMLFAFRKLDYDVVSAHLSKILQKENVAFEDDALKFIAREGQGSLRDSLSLLEQALMLQSGTVLTAAEIKQNLGLQNDEIGFNLFSCICQKNQGEALNILKTSDASGLDLSLLMDATANYFKFALILKTNGQKACSYLLEDERIGIQHIAEPLSYAALSEIFKLLSLSVKDIQRASNALSWAEIVVIDAINRAEWLSASEMLVQLKTQSRIQSQAQMQSQAQPQVQSQNQTQSRPRPFIAQSPTISASNVPAPGSKNIDLNLYKLFIAAAKKRSETLAARLNFVQLEAFDKNAVVFADTIENSTYLMLDAKDQKFFWESLEEIGLGAVAPKGKHTPEKYVSLGAIQEEEKKRNFAAKEKEILARESVKNLMLLTKEIKLTPVEN